MRPHDEDDRAAQHDDAEVEELRQRLSAGDPEAIEIRLVQIRSQRRDLEDQLQWLADTAEGIGRLDLMELVVGYMHGRPPA